MATALDFVYRQITSFRGWISGEDRRNQSVRSALETSMFPDVDVVIIGAGPIGLWTAILSKIRKQTLKIVIFEKYENYQRTHFLSIEPESLSEIPSNEQLLELKNDFLNKPRQPIQEIERKMRKIAENLGIVIIRGEEIIDPQSLMNRCPNASIFIGADGSRSKVRELISPNKFAFSNHLRYWLQVRYEAEGNGGRLLDIRKAPFVSRFAYQVLSKMTYSVNEESSRVENNRVSVTIRLHIDEKMYDKFSDAREKTALSLKDLKPYSTLLEDIYLWIGARRQELSEVRIKGTDRVTAIQLKTYSARVFVKAIDEKIWCLVGDSAAGFSYEKGFNAGLLCGNYLSMAVAERNDLIVNRKSCAKSKDPCIDGKVSEAFVKYAEAVNFAAHKTRSQVQNLDLGLGIFERIAMCIHYIPGFSLTKQELITLREIGKCFRVKAPKETIEPSQMKRSDSLVTELFDLASKELQINYKDELEILSKAYIVIKKLRSSEIYPLSIEQGLAAVLHHPQQENTNSWLRKRTLVVQLVTLLGLLSIFYAFAMASNKLSEKDGLSH